MKSDFNYWIATTRESNKISMFTFLDEVGRQAVKGNKHHNHDIKLVQPNTQAIMGEMNISLT